MKLNVEKKPRLADKSDKIVEIYSDEIEVNHCLFDTTYELILKIQNSVTNIFFFCRMGQLPFLKLATKDI